jgi:hypothetical protein
MWAFSARIPARLQYSFIRSSSLYRETPLPWRDGTGDRAALLDPRAQRHELVRQQGAIARDGAFAAPNIEHAIAGAEV